MKKIFKGLTEEQVFYSYKDRYIKRRQEIKKLKYILRSHRGAGSTIIFKLTRTSLFYSWARIWLLNFIKRKLFLIISLIQQDQNELMGSLVGLLHQQGLFAQGSEGE